MVLGFPELKLNIEIDYTGRNVVLDFPELIAFSSLVSICARFSVVRKSKSQKYNLPNI